MTEQEAIEEIKKLTCFFDNCGDGCLYGENNCAYKKAISALEEIQQYRKIGTVKECKEAMERQKLKHVNIEDWSPARCPSCDYELSTSLGDGYYRHPIFLERCPKCGQKIQWDENSEEMEDV